MIAHIDCFSGVAGDMLLAALIDCGLDVNLLKTMLSTMKGIENEWDLTISTVLKGSGRLAAKHVKVWSKFNHEPIKVPGSGSNSSDHDHSHSHSHSHSAIECHEPDSSTENCNERDYNAISRIIVSSSLPEEVKLKSLAVFKELAIAESKVHGCNFDEIHFHEVGAIDSIIGYFRMHSHDESTH
jgi:pyridinium-3,5-bisthiocarboxylic acid mononucleotide nickel chelatase